MTITIHKLPQVLETYYLDEARTIPTAHWGCAIDGLGYLGPRISRIEGKGIMAGWALTVSCPPGDNLATFAALQYMLDIAKQGRWVMVINPHEKPEENTSAIWSYMQSAMGWEIGFVGAVVGGYVRDVDEVRQKLEKEFSIFAHGTSPMPPTRSVDGVIGAPVVINGFTIRTGDLIVGDNDGVICIPKDQVEQAASKCRSSIVDEVNLLQHVREGMGAVDVMELREMLEGNIEVVE